MRRFIVAEASKSWIDGKPASNTYPSIAAAFEDIIQYNLERGYRLYSFQIHQLMTRANELNETIIAVFERVEPDAPQLPEAAASPR